MVVFFGKARCGKGELSDRFQRNHGFLQLGYMNTMYRLYQAAYGVPIEKEARLRPFLQDIGTGLVRQFDPDFHTRCLIQEAKRYIAENYPVPQLDVVINDARTPREGNRTEGRLPELIEEIVGRPAKRVISCFIDVSPDVQRHVMGEEAYTAFVSSGRSEHVTEPKQIEADIKVFNQKVGLGPYHRFLDETEHCVIEALREKGSPL